MLTDLVGPAAVLFRLEDAVNREAMSEITRVLAEVSEDERFRRDHADAFDSDPMTVFVASRLQRHLHDASSSAYAWMETRGVNEPAAALLYNRYQQEAKLAKDLIEQVADKLRKM